MKTIEPFIIKVTPEQSKVVQETLFKNGYTWFTGSNEVQLLDKEFLNFCGPDYKIPNKGKLTITHGGKADAKIPEITYQQFVNMYCSQDMFRKDDYIIFTKGGMPDDDSFPINYVFKQRKDSTYLESYLDCKKSKTNGWKYYRNFNKKFNNDEEYECDWRYATKEEIAEYDRLGKPFDVTTLKSKEMKFEKDKWYKVVDGKEKISGSYYVKNKFDNINTYDGEKLDSFKEVISDRNYRFDNINLGHIGTYGYVEVPLSEVQQYLPERHPDKFKSDKREELLEEAKRRYPMGTKYRGLNKSGIHRIIKAARWVNTNDNSPYGIDMGVDYVYLVSTNKWAEIVQDTLKVEDLVIDEIYYIQYGKEGDYIFKFSHTSNNVIYSPSYISLSTNLFHITSYFTTFQNSFTLIRVATQEEKDWLNVCIKANKFVPKEKALKTIVKGTRKCEFKVGDWLYVLKKSNEGDLIKIKSINKENLDIKVQGWWVEHEPTSFSGGGFRMYGNGYYPNKDFRLATPEEIEKYKKKVEFVLPENWAVACCDSKIVGKWFDSQRGVQSHCYATYDTDKDGYLHRFNMCGQDILKGGNLMASFHSFYLRTGYTVITLEHFIKYVLKETVEQFKNIECEECRGEGRVMKAKLYPSGHTEVCETCDNCDGEGYIEKDTSFPEMTFRSNETNESTNTKSSLKLISIEEEETELNLLFLNKIQTVNKSLNIE